MLYVKAKVTALDGTYLPADAAFGPVNLFLHSLFSQVDILLNGTLITASTNTYPYRAMIETLLGGEDAKSSQLTSALYYKDQPGRMDSVDFADNARNSFYPCDAMLARVIAIATCLSVCLSVCHAPVLCQNEESYRHDFFTIW